MKIFLSGATGQMGKAVTDTVLGTEHQITAGYAKDDGSALPYPVYQELEEITEDGDVMIDFSTPKALNDLLTFSKSKQIGLVIASTGHNEEQVALIKEASKNIPILFSGNLSLGVNVMEMIAEKMSRMLEGFDIEIVEKHHRKKKDAPSGTANMLFDAVNKGREDRLHKNDGRSGFTEGRDDNEVGISAVRGGSIVGEHTVIFAGEDEVVEIKHMASSKKIFAKGALKAAEFLENRESGLYDMNDVLGDQ